MEVPITFWIIFHVSIALFLWLDLRFLPRCRRHSLRSSLWLSGCWVALAFGFNVLVYVWLGQESALQFFTGYVVEKSLSIDNLFVILLIFTQMKVPREEQHRVLFLGVLGALVLRLGLILGGLALLREFSWLSYVLGGVLCVTAVRLALVKGEAGWLRWVRKKFLVEEGGNGSFFVRKGKKWRMTSLFGALLFIEGADLIFALDSVPAIFAISRDPFIVYTSNVFAILGLRELYAVLLGILRRLRYLHWGLALILCFVGGKLLLAGWVEIPLLVCLGVIGSILMGMIVSSYKLGGRAS